MKGKRRKYYMLFLYGQLGAIHDFSSFVDNLFISLSDDLVKFVQDKYTAILHFSSRESMESLNELFKDVFDENVQAYFLIERPDKIGMRIEDSLLQHLFDLEADTGYITPYLLDDSLIDEDFIAWNKRQIEDLNLEDDEFAEEDESVNDVKKIKTNYVEPLRMDRILDKISAYGFDSLTADEKKYLKNLSE